MFWLLLLLWRNLLTVCYIGDQSYLLRLLLRLSLSYVFSSFMTIHPIKILILPRTHCASSNWGFISFTNSKNFFSHYCLIYFHFPILAFLKVLMKIGWTSSNSIILHLRFCALLYNSFRLPSSLLTPFSAVLPLYLAVNFNDCIFHFQNLLSSLGGDFFVFFLLTCSWFTMSCYRCTAKWFSYTCVCVYSFSDSFPLQVIIRCWI